jgi:CRISPR-associated protein Cas5d
MMTTVLFHPINQKELIRKNSWREMKGGTMIKESNPFRLKVSGTNACFTRPEMKVERVSYDVMTPSAARGILEAILWKPAIRWKIQQIDVLNPIKWASVRRNEIGAVVSAKSAEAAMNRGTGRLGMYADEAKNRQQRASLFLRDVAYVIHAVFEMTDKAGEEDNVTKFEQMFLRRSTNGQCFHRPYFGCREFPVDFELIPQLADQLPTVPESRDLGWMLYDLVYTGKEAMPQFFHAKMKEGTINLRNVEVRS